MRRRALLPSAALVLCALLIAPHLAAAARNLDRNSALIGWSEEATAQKIVLSTQYGKVLSRQMP